MKGKLMAETVSVYVEQYAMKRIKAFLDDVVAGEADVRTSYSMPNEDGNGLIVKKWQEIADGLFGEIHELF